MSLVSVLVLSILLDMSFSSGEDFKFSDTKWCLALFWGGGMSHRAVGSSTSRLQNMLLPPSPE